MRTMIVFKKIYKAAMVLTTFFLLACEEEVVLDLGDIDKKLVVEAVLSNYGSLASVSLSYSKSFYDSLAFDKLTDASVELQTEAGESEQLTLLPDGIFYTQKLQAEYGKKYTLKIETEGEMVTAETILPKPVEIKRVQFIPSPFEFNGDSMNAIVYADDITGEDNFFRMYIYKIGQKRPRLQYFTTDELSSNGEIQMPVYFENFWFGDTVIVELMHTTKEVSEYYSGLGNNTGGSFNSIAPGNPVNNLPEDVLGIFAAYAYDIDTIVVQGFPAF
ncbi:MAG: DUF4249 domain-containing protein [Prolixibacteraceae bacterium]|nr:DUF4249 domain-containing protein [Prolixibacteraceae bacterium]